MMYQWFCLSNWQFKVFIGATKLYGKICLTHFCEWRQQQIIKALKAIYRMQWHYIINRKMLVIWEIIFQLSYCGCFREQFKVMNTTGWRKGIISHLWLELFKVTWWGANPWITRYHFLSDFYISYIQSYFVISN